jgi:hypothetical protein
MLALHLQTGLRASFTNAMPNSVYVPIDLDVVLTPHPRVDVGVSFNVAGDVGGQPRDYVGLLNLGVFMRVRL